MGEVILQSHMVGLTSYRLASLSFHVNLASHCWVTTFQNLTLKFKGQGHGWGHSLKSQCGSNILSTRIPFVLCQSALPFLRYSIFKIWPWKSRVNWGHGWGNNSKSQCGSNILSTHIPFVPCQSALPFLSYDYFQNLTLKIKGQGQMTLMLHNYRSTQFHRTSNGIHPSSGSKDMGSAKSGPSAAWFDKLLANGQTHMGQMGK